MVGPYRFSRTDARRTLLHSLDFLDGFPIGVHPHQERRRERIRRVVGGLDLRRADVARLRRPLELVWAELLTARDDAIVAEALPPSQDGHITTLALGDGGLPKRSVDRAAVDFAGVVGDRQRTRNHHGSPFQALCLWNVENIERLVADGHPIAASRAGENVTVEGLDWSTLVPGVRLALGEVLCEISSYAVPCAQNARWFRDGDFSRIHHREGPVSRLYATVLEPGSIATGDAAVVEPA